MSIVAVAGDNMGVPKTALTVTRTPLDAELNAGRPESVTTAQ
jgi:hypothetical protein